MKNILAAAFVSLVSLAAFADDKTGTQRCLKGGSRGYQAHECASGFRYYAYGNPGNDSAFFGMRFCINNIASGKD